MQHKLLKTKEDVQPYLEYGVVVEEDGILRVETSLGSYPALRAASCLVMPHSGDYVLTALDGDGRSALSSPCSCGIMPPGRPTSLSLKGIQLFASVGEHSRSRPTMRYQLRLINSPLQRGPATPHSRNAHSSASPFSPGSGA